MLLQKGKRQKNRRDDSNNNAGAINDAFSLAVAGQYAITGMDIMILPHGPLKTWGEFLLYALLWQRALHAEL